MPTHVDDKLAELTAPTLLAIIKELHDLRAPLVDALGTVYRSMTDCVGDEWAEEWLGEVWTQLPLNVRALAGDEDVADMLADAQQAATPPLPAPIHAASQWCWEPLRPRLKTRVRITDTRWDDKTWWIETEALESSHMRIAGHRRWDALSSFIESAVAIDPDL